MAYVRRTHVGELLVGVVRLVGQADAALYDVQDVALGIERVGRHVEPERPADADALENAELVYERGDGGHGVDVGEVGLDRAATRRLDRVFVHETRVQIADLALLGALGGIGRPGLVEDLAYSDLGIVAQVAERSGDGTVGRDLRTVEPSAVDMPEQVVGGAYLGVELAGVDSIHASHATAADQPRVPGPGTS